MDQGSMQVELSSGLERCPSSTSAARVSRGVIKRLSAFMLRPGAAGAVMKRLWSRALHSVAFVFDGGSGKGRRVRLERPSLAGVLLLCLLLRSAWSSKTVESDTGRIKINVFLFYHNISFIKLNIYWIQNIFSLKMFTIKLVVMTK